MHVSGPQTAVVQVAGQRSAHAARCGAQFNLCPIIAAAAAGRPVLEVARTTAVAWAQRVDGCPRWRARQRRCLPVGGRHGL